MVSQQAVLGQASHNGYLHLWSVDLDTKSDTKSVTPSLKPLADCPSVAIDVKSSCLSLDWAHRSTPGYKSLSLMYDMCWIVFREPAVCAISMSNGKLFRVPLTEDGFVVQEEWKAHDMECWITAFDPTSIGAHVLYSGADDCKLKGWDTRISTEYPIFQNNNSHSAGVTVISPHLTNPHILATGSYDEHVRLFDTRNIRRPLSEHTTDGGVWRVRWHPTDSTLLLTGSMRNGFHVLKTFSENMEDYEFSTVGTHIHAPEEESLAYGCDWSRHGERKGMIGSCSFYDQQLHLWNIQLD